MLRFRDSRGRFSSRPRDSAGRYRSESWYNRSQGQKARYAAARAAESYSARRAAEIAAEYQAAAERFPAPRPSGIQQRQHQDAWGLQAIGSVNVEPGARVEVKLELHGKVVYEYDGRADEFAPLELRRALDEWSVNYMGDEAHYWRAPELSLWRIDKTLNPQTLKATSISVYADSDAEALLREAIDTHGHGRYVLTGEASTPAPADWPEEEDALPE